MASNQSMEAFALPFLQTNKKKKKIIDRNPLSLNTYCCNSKRPNINTCIIILLQYKLGSHPISFGWTRLDDEGRGKNNSSYVFLLLFSSNQSYFSFALLLLDLPALLRPADLEECCLLLCLCCNDEFGSFSSQTIIPMNHPVIMQIDQSLQCMPTNCSNMILC